jgi:hypothetical protein
MITAVNPPTSITSGASGQYASVTVRYTSTLSLSGKQLHFNPALWVSSYDVENSLPTTGFRVTYPFSPQTLNFTLLPAPNSQSQLNLRAELTVINNKTFDVTLFFVHFADINNFISNSNIDGLQRIIQKRIGSNSVYDEQRLLVFRVAYQTGSTLHQAYTDINYQASHYGRSINNGPPIAPSIMVLTRGAIPVNSFSLVADTKVNFSINTTQIVAHEYYAGVFQINAIGGGNYWNSTNLQYGRLSNVVNSVEAIQSGQLKNPVQLTQIGGGYSGSFVIDKAYFSNSGIYRVFVAYRIGSQWQSFLSNEIAVLENFETTFGATTATWTVGSDTYADCLNGVQPGQSVTLEFEADKNDYNTNLAANGVGGSWNQNFVSVNVIQVNGAPVSNQIPTGSSYPVIITEDSNTHTTSTGIIIPQGWAGEVIFFAAIYTFSVPTPQGNLTDTVVRYVQLGVSDVTGGVSLVSVRDDENVELTYLCDDYDGLITVTVQNDTGLTGLSIEWFVHELGNFNNQYPGSIVSADSNYSDGEAVIVLDPSQLPIGIPICITLISTGADEPADCPCFDFVGNLYSLSVTNDAVNYGLAYDFSDLIGYQGSNWTFEVLDYNNNPVILVVNPPNNNGVIAFSDAVPSGGFFIISMSANVVVYTSFCTYEFCFDLITSTGGGGFDIDLSQTVCTGLNTCQTFGRPSGCEEVDAGITAECVEGVITVTSTGSPADVLTDELDYYDFVTQDFVPYLGPTEVQAENNPECEFFVRRTIQFDNGCDPVEIYELFGPCCPPDECPELECEPQEDYDPDLNELTLSIECGSEVADDILIEYSIDGGVTYLEYTDPIDMTGIESVMWRMIVDYSISFPICEPNQFEYEGEFSLDGENPNLCISNPGLTATFLNGCHTVEETGDVYFVESDVTEYSTDFGETWIAYSGEVCGPNVVLFRRIVMYTNMCEKSCVFVGSADPCCNAIPCEYGCYFNFLFDESAEGCNLVGIEIAGCTSGEVAGDIIFISNMEPTDQNFEDFGTIYDNDVLTCQDVTSWHFRSTIAKNGCPDKLINASFDCEECSSSGDDSPDDIDLDITYWGPLAD